MTYNVFGGTLNLAQLQLQLQLLPQIRLRLTIVRVYKS